MDAKNVQMGEYFVTILDTLFSDEVLKKGDEGVEGLLLAEVNLSVVLGVSLLLIFLCLFIVDLR